MLDRVQVHVGDAAARCRERGQLEVVGGEQGHAAVGRGQVARAGLGQGQAVVGRGAAADLVHQHQRAFGGVVEDVAGLGHLHHEGGLPLGQVVAGADAGEDAVDRTDPRACRRHEAADVRQQHDQRVLAHVGALAAHVGAGDDEHAAVGVQFKIVRLERLLAHSFHHRVAAAFDRNAGLRRQLRARPVQRLRALGETRQRVQLAQRRRAAPERLQPVVERVQQLFVQQPLARQRPLACAQYLVLELLELLGDVALGVGQRLPAGVVGRRLGRLRLADLDVVAVHPVVAELEGGDAGGLALARFQFHQEPVGVGGERAQLVQLGVVAVGEHAAVARQHRRLFHQGGGQQVRLGLVLAQAFAKRLQAR